MEGTEAGMHADFVDDAVRTLRAAAPGELSRVSEAAAVLAHGDHLLVQVVRDARAAGRSWSQIAAALETTTAESRSRWGSPRQVPDRAGAVTGLVANGDDRVRLAAGRWGAPIDELAGLGCATVAR